MILYVARKPKKAAARASLCCQATDSLGAEMLSGVVRIRFSGYNNETDNKNAVGECFSCGGLMQDKELIHELYRPL